MKLRFSLLALLFYISNICTAHADDARYTLNVENFNAITVVDGISVDYYCNADSAGWIVFTASPDMASNISFSNHKEHLRVQTLADEKPLKGLPRVRVYSSSLHYIENSGDSTLRIYDPMPVPKFTAKQIGNGTIEIHGLSTEKFNGDAAAGHGRLSVDGKAGKVKLHNVGTGLIDASTLEADKVTSFILGSGKIHVNATGELKLTGAGSGIVINHASGTKVVNRSIGIKAKNIGEEKP